MSRLRTERLELRPLVPSDFAQWSEVRHRCHIWLEKWEPRPPTGSPNPSRDPQAFTNRCRVRERERSLGTAFDFGLWHEGWFCGEINVSHVARGAFLSAHVGYWIDERFAGKGLVAEGLLAVFEFAFEQAGLHRVQISIMPRNAASLRVVEKLGLRSEGIAHGYIQIAGIWEDHVRFGLTAEEWEARRDEMAEQLTSARNGGVAQSSSSASQS
ncbi:GNAT family N-acetyltransferase [Candidatus Poriferisodalis sp.]|uniref:GNAT family N-acetyltransferase n=1 Tax=Candidatus Poriferisodalis sp. TaxID=3101277 RepID=UPI003D0D43D7